MALSRSSARILISKTRFYPITTILFDFSGTLADDLVSTWMTVCEILRLYEKPIMSLEEFREVFSLPYWQIFENFGLSERTAKVSCLNHYKKMIQKYAFHTKIFQDAVPVLKFLSETKKLGIVSQTPQKTLDAFLVKNDLKKYFTKIISLEDSSEQKPSPLPLLIACESIGCKTSEAIYVGDQYEDILAAKNARMISVAISRKHSYHTYAKLLSSKPNFLITNLREIASLELLQC